MSLFGRGRKATEQALAAARADCQRLEAERDRLAAELDRQRQRADQAEAGAAASRAEVVELLALVGRFEAEAEATGKATETADARPLAEASDTIERCWPLVLADLERRWAAGTGALPEARGIHPGPVSAQVSEGLAREVERLREEVGVDVSFTLTKPVDPDNPVVFLLTATDLLGAMAASCERVAVELDGRLILSGEMWSDLGDDIEASRRRALTAGALVDPLEIDGDRVRISLHP